jgi:DNA polymerase III delta subunit
MITVLTGSDRTGLRQRLNELIAEFKKSNDELAVERLDVEETGAQPVIDAVASLPFLSERKLVIVRGLSADKQAAETLEQIISSTADSTDLIIYEPAADKRTAYFKKLKSVSQFEEYNEQDAKSLPAWLADQAAELGGVLSTADANYLVERVGTNQQLLLKEVEKLIIYDPKISRQTIDILTEKAPQSRVFDLLDAAFAGHKDNALKLYEEQRAQRVEPQEIMAMIAWQLRLICLAKLGSAKSAAQIAQDVRMSPYPVTKAQGLAKKLDLARLREMVAGAEKIDRLAKTKPVDLDEAIRTYIATL